MRLCGHAPDTDEHRSDDLAARPYIPSGVAWGGLIVQQVGRIHHQPMLPDCTGESIAACIEAQTSTRVSGVDIWREGLRRTGEVPALDQGLAFTPALIGVERRGWADYREGEETHLPTATPGLEEELEAADRPGRVLERFRIPTGPMLLAAIDDALASGLGVVFGAMVTEDYQGLGQLPMAPGSDPVIVGPGMLGANGHPHAQRIFGRYVDAGRRYYLVQNSWSSQWGGFCVTGRPQPGCVVVMEECIAAAYDVMALRVKP